MAVHHTIFGEVAGDLADSAHRHDAMLGLDLVRRPEDADAPDAAVFDRAVGEAVFTNTSDEAHTLSQSMKNHLDRVVDEVGRFLKGDGVGERVRTVAEAVLTKSHVVLEGASGTGKTVAVTLVARVLNMPFQRIDALPDLSDLDIIGGEVFEGGQFRLKRSKLLRPLVLMIIDEFGRLSATCANAFLQALEEREVGVSDLRGSGVTRLQLSPGFVVAAAMNPQTYGGSGGVNEALFDRISVGLRMPMPNNAGMNEALEEAEVQLPGNKNKRKEPKKLGLPPGVTLLKIWSAINLVKLPPALRQAIVDANFLVSPPGYRKANGWTECEYSPHDRAERKAVESLEADSSRLLFEGSNPRGMTLTVLRAKANAFFRGPNENGELVVTEADVRRAAQAALLFRLKSFPGTPPASVADLIDRAVNLAIPKGREDYR